MKLPKFPKRFKHASTLDENRELSVEEKLVAEWLLKNAAMRAKLPSSGRTAKGYSALTEQGSQARSLTRGDVCGSPRC